MTTIQMKRSEALGWVKAGIERGKYDVALEILNDLIEQEKKYEEAEKGSERKDENPATP